MAGQLQCMSSVQLKQCQEILKAHKCSISSPQALWAQLRQGVLVDGDKYFWLDNEGNLAVELYARTLIITWGSSPEYWTYSFETIPDTEYSVEVAYLKNVCWLNVRVEFDTIKMPTGVAYEALFDIELVSGAEGWSAQPVTFELATPNYPTQKFDLMLDQFIGKGRTQISIGKFLMLCQPYGSIISHMYQHDSPWKNGLIMRGVIIKPFQAN